MKILVLCSLLTINLIVGAQSKCDSTLLLTHLKTLVGVEKPRHDQNVEVLNTVADYIYHEFSKYSSLVTYQTYELHGKAYKNVICSFGPLDAERIIIGAHYDVCGYQDGADDNASGIAGLLELARLFKGQTLTNRIDLVAYTLEEPPNFATENMGSYKHAEYLHDNNIKVKGMIVLEMIGYYSDERKSQHFPIKGLGLFYGTKGNFITSVQTFKSGKFIKQFNRQMKRNDFIKHKKFTAPAKVSGVDFSDHRNYWRFGYAACMITDTAFMRNPNYHQKSDTIETLNLTKMAAVVDAVFNSILKLQS